MDWVARRQMFHPVSGRTAQSEQNGRIAPSAPIDLIGRIDRATVGVVAVADVISARAGRSAPFVPTTSAR